MTNHSANLRDLIENKELPVILVAVDIRSAYNVGAMFRTADGTGQTGIIVTGYSPTPDNPKVAKTALGADYQVPWFQVENAVELLELKNVLHVGLELATHAQDIFSWPIPADKKIFLYVGNEVTGLPAELMIKLDVLLQLPMRGSKKSLNVAEATSIALYEFYRKIRT